MGYQNSSDGTICNDRSKRAMTRLPAEGLVGAMNFPAGPGQDPGKGPRGEAPGNLLAFPILYKQKVDDN